MKRHSRHFSGTVRTALFLSVAALAVTACSRQSASGTRPVAAAMASVAAEGTSVTRLDPGLDTVISPGTVVEKVAGDFQFVEGPLWHNGEVWFADLVGNKLYAAASDGKARIIIDKSGGLQETAPGSYQGSNGMAVDKDGTVLMAQHGLRRIARVGPDMKVTAVVERNSDGAHLNSPNDMAFAPDGALWFTDPPLGLVGQDKDPAKEARFNAVYRYLNGKAVAVITDLTRPNGIAFSPDGSKLYVSNSAPEMFVNVYDVSPDGSVSKARKFLSYPAPLPDDVPDGLKVDSLGNVWTTGPGGIRIVTPDGKVLGQIKTPDKAQSNIAFGGDDGRTAYITASGNVYRLRTAIPGAKPLYGR